MASKISINLDTCKENFIPVKCKQNDDLTLEAFIYENGLELNLTNKEITIQALKSDNTYIIQNTSITKENNKIVADLIRDFSRIAGKTEIEIVLTESSKQNTTFSFYLEVVGSVIRGAVQSSNTATILEALDNKIIEAGQVKQETEELVQSGGAATKGEVQEINASLVLKASQQALNVEKGRIDNIVALPQTVDNVETADIRVGADGVTYQSAGDSVRSQINKIKTESNNLINFQTKTYLNDVITVSGEVGTSVLNIKANGTTTANKTFQIYMDTNLTDKNFLLKPNTTYTLSAKRKGGTYVDTRAVSLILKRRDTLVNVATINLGQVILGTQQTVTFTTPNLNKYYFEFVFATGAFNFNVDVIINLIEGSTANYTEYLVDLNDSLQIKKDVEKLKKSLGKTYNIIVAKDGTGDYTTLSEAVANAKDFDTIFIKNGNYENEIVKAWLKTVFIVGESKTGVIISNTTGEYATPPIEMGTGLLRNLTIYAKKVDGVTPSNKCYALHSESSVANYGYFEIDNCDIISEWRQSWGMGMRGGTTYRIINTDFNGGVYFHDCEHSYRATKQVILFDNCNMYRLDNGAGLLLQDQQMPTAVNIVAFRRCFIKSKLGTSVLFKKWTGTDVIDAIGWSDFPTWTLDFTSWGNSESVVNK